jgi:hypothetical protein
VRHKPAAAAARPKQRSGIADKIQQWGRYICCQVRRWRLGQGLSRSSAPPGCPAVRCRAIWRRRPARCRTRRTDPSTPTRSCRPPPVEVITAITDARAGLASFARARMDSSSSSGPGRAWIAQQDPGAGHSPPGPVSLGGGRCGQPRHADR